MAAWTMSRSASLSAWIVLHPDYWSLFPSRWINVCLFSLKKLFFQLGNHGRMKIHSQSVGTCSSPMSTIFYWWAILISVKHYCGLSILLGCIQRAKLHHDTVKESPPSRTKWTFPLGLPVWLFMVIVQMASAGLLACLERSEDLNKAGGSCTFQTWRMPEDSHTVLL